jgi:DNA polymerase III epsilon subunit-like protein
MDPHGEIHRPIDGITQEELFHKLQPLIAKADILVGHKGKWDVQNINDILFKRFAQPDQTAQFDKLPVVCTMLDLADAIGHIDTIGKPNKWPELKEALDHYIPDNDFDPRHKGFEDAKATLKLFLAAYEAGDLPLQCAI